VPGLARKRKSRSNGNCQEEKLLNSAQKKKRKTGGDPALKQNIKGRNPNTQRGKPNNGAAKKEERPSQDFEEERKPSAPPV